MNGLQHLLDHYGVYIAHLTTLMGDTSTKNRYRHRIFGNLQMCKQPKVLFASALNIHPQYLSDIPSLPESLGSSFFKDKSVCQGRPEESSCFKSR